MNCIKLSYGLVVPGREQKLAHSKHRSLRVYQIGAKLAHTLLRTATLVLRPGDIDGFSVAVMCCDKAPCASNGRSLVKHSNAVTGHDSNAESGNIILKEH